MCSWEKNLIGLDNPVDPWIIRENLSLGAITKHIYCPRGTGVMFYYLVHGAQSYHNGIAYSHVQRYQKTRGIRFLLFARPIAV